MNRRVKRAAVAAALIVGTAAAGSGTAAAVFPNFSGCPSGGADFQGCLNIQSRSGSLTIKGFTVPIGESLEIRGGLRQVGTGAEFLPARGTNGFFARDIQVPGGLLGINFPLPGNAVTARAQLVGPPSNIRVDVATNSVSMPVKLKLTNPLIGSGCQIASDANPVRLNLITGTTAPPPPNTPISGSFGRVAFNPTYLSFTGARNVDNSFAVPSANSCGFFPIGILIDGLVNAKLRIPSAGGNNTMIIVNDLAIGSPPA